LVLVSVRGWVKPRAIVLLEGIGKLKKNLVFSLGLEPMTDFFLLYITELYQRLRGMILLVIGCHIIIRGSWSDMIVLNIYAPTEDKLIM
jgi:hypothetical protein